jgi:hypothetical protein
MPALDQPTTKRIAGVVAGRGLLIYVRDGEGQTAAQ